MPNTVRRWTRPASSLTLALFALTACTNPDPKPLPTATTEPVFANEEEALGAVTTTYEEYLRISNTILIEGGAGVERIDAIVGDKLAEQEHASLVELAGQGLTLTGAPHLVQLELSEWYSLPDAAGVSASATACIDLTAVQVVDGVGNSAVLPERPKTRTWSIQVGPGSSGQADLVVLARDFASEGESCEN